MHRTVKQGHETVNYHECVNCCLAFVTCETEGQSFGVLNANMLGIDR